MLTKSHKIPVYAPTIIFVVVMFLLTIYMYHPGIMTNDSVGILKEVVSQDKVKYFTFLNLTPPTVAFTWYLLNHIYFGPLSMLVLNNMLFWSALYIFSLWLLPNSNKGRIIFILFFGLFPPVFTQLGLILKDITLFTSLFLVCSLLLFFDQKIAKKKYILLPAILFFLFYALLTRHNAFSAVIVLCFWLVSMITVDIPFRKTKIFFISVILFGIFCLGSYMVDRYLTHGRTTYPEQIVKVGDVLGISALKHTVILPNYLIKSGCGTKSISKFNAGSDLYIDSSCWNYTDKKKIQDLNWFWIQSIYKNPYTYLKRRIMLFGWLCVGNAQYYTSSVPNPYSFIFKQNNLFRLYYKFINLFVINFQISSLVFLKNSAFLNPISVTHISHLHILFIGGAYWLLCLLMIFISCFSKEKLKAYKAIFWIALSGFVYGGGYIFYAPTPEYRFWLWTVMAAMMSLVIYVQNISHYRKKT